jgi:hypothetical protein
LASRATSPSPGHTRKHRPDLLIITAATVMVLLAIGVLVGLLAL